MASTYEPIATSTLGSAASSVTFSSISGSYTDLVFVVNAAEQNNTPVYLRVNGLTTAIYSNTYLFGNGSTATSGRYSAAALGGAGVLIDNYNERPFPTDFSGQATYHFMNYSNTTTNKTVLIRHGNASGFVDASVVLIQTTSAITSLNIYPFSGNFNTGSTFTLYGIKAA